MRILIATHFKSNDVAFELAKRGHIVTVLTNIPNYPQGKFYKGYGIFRRRIETVNGVKIYRTFVIPRGKGGGIMLALNYFSWAFIASVWAFFLAVFHRYDAIIVHETSPRDIACHPGISGTGGQMDAADSAVFLGAGPLA